MIRVEPVHSVELHCGAGGWAFERENREAIGRHWQKAVACNPSLWNGRTLICTSATVEQGAFRGELAAVDYASFVAWRDWGRPDSSVVNCFGVPVVFSSDGALLIGVMAPWTLNAGKAYPPSGSLEPRDVQADGTVDVFANMRTELLEETGLDLAMARAGAMAAIFEGPRLAIVQRYDFALTFAEIAARFAAHAAAEERPELSAVEGLRSSAEIDHRMPPYVEALIRHFHC